MLMTFWSVLSRPCAISVINAPDTSVALEHLRNEVDDSRGTHFADLIAEQPGCQESTFALRNRLALQRDSPLVLQQWTWQRREDGHCSGEV